MVEKLLAVASGVTMATFSGQSAIQSLGRGLKVRQRVVGDWVLTWHRSCLVTDMVAGFSLPFFWPHRKAGGILVPWPGIEPAPSAVKVWSPNHWTSSEFPTGISFEGKLREPCWGCFCLLRFYAGSDNSIFPSLHKFTCSLPVVSRVVCTWRPIKVKNKMSQLLFQ